jgi:hypothetical protein
MAGLLTRAIQSIDEVSDIAALGSGGGRNGCCGANGRGGWLRPARDRRENGRMLTEASGENRKSKKNSGAERNHLPCI